MVCRLAWRIVHIKYRQLCRWKNCKMKDSRIGSPRFTGIVGIVFYGVHHIPVVNARPVPKPPPSRPKSCQCSLKTRPENGLNLTACLTDNGLYGLPSGGLSPVTLISG